ncbi:MULTISPECIES: NlpC/P60 family protein [unclassified Brevibacterium]|uniref:NlpC/P60 family protein n=1 Tax=unclassified Brevibacterium TaxID=2614124 RepID=UPI001091E638|nr:NlpC/P60 family protein [Brevibacterium sp. S22]TGD32573.1 cell wall-associated hydrolase [Brevibacterium sp. S22]
MTISRTLTTTVLTAGILAGGTMMTTAPAQADQTPAAQAPAAQSSAAQAESGRTASAQSDDRRDEIISRAQTWVDQGVPYNWDATHPDPQGKQYRMDCSGFVSMAWGLDDSLNTVTLPDVSHKIDKDELKPGDVLMKGGPGTEGANGHVVIFNGWANDDKTAYHALEENGSLGSVAHEVSYPYDQDDSFVPYRLNGL